MSAPRNRHNAAVRTPEGQTFGINALKFWECGRWKNAHRFAASHGVPAWRHTRPETLLIWSCPRPVGRKTVPAFLKTYTTASMSRNTITGSKGLVDDLAPLGDLVCRELRGSWALFRGRSREG